MINKKPKVSVVMPAYNTGRYIGEAIQSILDQTFRDFELIIVNDGSQDTTDYVINQYSLIDDRIKVISKPNTGIVDSTNQGTKTAKGKYIARMDSDDIAHFERLERQVKYLDENPHITAISTSVKHTGHVHHFSFPSSNPSQLNLMPELVNPALMYRVKDVKEKGITLREENLYAEDAGFMNELASHGLILGNLQEPLLKYRVHSKSVTRQYNPIQSENYKRIIRERFAFLQDNLDVDIFLKRIDYYDDSLIEKFNYLEKKVDLKYGQRITSRYFFSTYIKILTLVPLGKKIKWFWKKKSKILIGAYHYTYEIMRKYILSWKYRGFWG